MTKGSPKHHSMLDKQRNLAEFQPGFQVNDLQRAASGSEKASDQAAASGLPLPHSSESSLSSRADGKSCDPWEHLSGGMAGTSDVITNLT